MRNAAVIAGLLLLAACGNPLVTYQATYFPFAEADVLTTIATGKPIADHVYSLYTGKNCAYTRMQAGRTYCVEDEANPAPQVRCYRTLGSVDCFGADDPRKGRYQEVGQGNEPMVTYN